MVVCQPPLLKHRRNQVQMKLDTNSLAHTKWECKYHIIFAPKYRRQIIYGKIKADIGQMLRKLCEYKGIEIIEAEACKDHIHMLASSNPFYEVIVTTSGNIKKLAHDRYWVLAPVTIDDCVLYLGPHFLSVDCRKSRKSLFSISSRAISFSYASAVVNGRVRGRPLRLAGIPFSTDAFLLLYLGTQLSMCLYSRPSASAICVRLIPSSRMAMICGSISSKCVCLLLLITIPPV